MSGSISNEDIQKVREASDLVEVVGEYVPVRQRGKDFWCCCPLHNEKTPSFKIDPVNQLWHCFGCHEGGDVFAFIMAVRELSFPETVRYLAERSHIDIHEEQGSTSYASTGIKDRLRRLCAASAAFYHKQLMCSKDDDAASARTYLSGRNLGGTIPKEWNLGFATGKGSLVHHLASLGYKPDEMIQANVAMQDSGNMLRDRFYNRVMFPINDTTGDCIAFGGRIIGEGNPKYLNSQETLIFHKSDVLYGLDKAKAAMTATGTAIVVEGYTDVIACHVAGLKNVVATLGTALTRKHIRLLSRHAKNTIVYLFDGDKAGQKAADRALAFIDSSMTPEGSARPIDLRAVTLPDNLDPAEFLEQRGVEDLKNIIEDAPRLLQYGIDRRISSHDLRIPEGRSAAMADALSILAPIKDSILAKQYAIQIASITRMREQDALIALDRLKPPLYYDIDTSNQRNSMSDSHGGASNTSPTPRNQQVSSEHHKQTSHNIFVSSGGQKLSQQERARRRFELTFLSLFVYYPELSEEFLSTLSAVNFHSELMAQVAHELVELFIQKNTYTPAQIMSIIGQKIPQSSSFITSAKPDVNGNPASVAHYYAEELGIRDMEDSIAELRAQLSSGNDDVFEVLSSMQKDLELRKKAHKPL